MALCLWPREQRRGGTKDVQNGSLKIYVPFRLWRLRFPKRPTHRGLQLEHKTVWKPQGELNDCIICVRSGNWILSPMKNKPSIRLNYGILLHLLIFLLTELFIKVWLRVPKCVHIQSLYTQHTEAHFMPYLYFHCTLRTGWTTQEDFQLHFQNW